MKTARVVVFPGQGSQRPGMGAFVERVRPDLLERLGEILNGEDAFAHIDESTRYMQPAVLCASLAGWTRYIERTGVDPDFAAGHSLGEFAALVASGSLAEDDALRLVVMRGELMDRLACRQDESGMVAVIGGGAQDFALRAAELGVVMANDNSPGQIVMSGPDAALARVVTAAERIGLKVRRLAIRGAFHHPSMAAAAAELRAALRAVRWLTPRIPVFSAGSTRPFVDPPGELAENLIRPVRWRETMLQLHRHGVRSFVDMGPGTVLSGLVTRTLPDVEVEALDQRGAPVA